MPLLSHYTSRAGLEGIAETHSLWGTNFLDLNDSSEFLYALRILLRDAVEDVLKQVPNDQKRTDCDLEAEALRLSIMLRDVVRTGDGYGHLYVTSFARATNDDQERRGILTLWHRYTQHEGYCLQFDRRDLEHMLQLDSQRSNYSSLGLHQVRYGVDRDTYNYKQLRFQMAQNAIFQILRARSDIRIEPKWHDMWAESNLVHQVSIFCATHKDPCFEDEREFRLFGYPAPKGEPRVLQGPAFRKPIKTTPNGKRYIDFGEDWRPGISPRRIIVGIKADPNINHLVAKFPKRPEVLHANLPIA